MQTIVREDTNGNGEHLGGAARSRGNTVAHLISELREGIRYGRYAPGQRLIEADLTRELGVSRGPLREAFRRLTAEGLIESIPNRGALVRRLSQQETRELFEIRAALEVLAAELAAKNIDSPGVRAKFEAAIAPIWTEASHDKPSTYFDENKDFHLAIADASGNTQLAILGHQLRSQLTFYQMSSMLRPQVIASSNREHRDLAKAILAGDAALSADLMRKHFGSIATFWDELPATVFRSGADSE
ncbi:MAG TPA: GntR family transcriptional regulator [Pseudolabrys sp.]|nr:GntR family transcriptional regulator [Pseudolabrys sp.]